MPRTEEAERPVGRQHAGFQNDAPGAVAQDGLEPVMRRSARPLDLDVRADGLGRPEQHQRLIGQMRAEIVPKAAPWAAALPPAIPHLRPIAADLGFDLHHVAKLVRFERARDGQEVAVEAPVLEYGQMPARVRGQGSERAALGQRQGEGLVDDHMLAGAQCGLGQCEMRVVRRRDHHQLGAGMPGGIERVRDDLGGGIGRARAFPLAGADRRENEAVRRRYERRVEHAAGVAEADQRDPRVRLRPRRAQSEPASGGWEGISASSISFARSAAGRVPMRSQYRSKAGRFSIVPNIMPQPIWEPR